MCSTSLWEQVETLASAAMAGDGDATTGSSVVIVREPGGGCGAAEVSLVSTGTREPEAEGLDCVATTPKDREAGPLTDGTAEEVGAAGAFFTFPPLVFFIPGGGGDEGATGEAGGDRSERSDEGANPNRAPKEDDVELSDIFF